jgi:hypothetical protein
MSLSRSSTGRTEPCGDKLHVEGSRQVFESDHTPAHKRASVTGAIAVAAFFAALSAVFIYAPRQRARIDGRIPSSKTA